MEGCNGSVGRRNAAGAPLSVWAAAFVFFAVSTVLCLLSYPCLMSDTMSRYAPMADAFARGDWTLAYHPRFGVLFGTLAGLTAWATGLDGARACQAVSFFFFSFSAVPVWALVKRVFGDSRVAWTAALLTLASSECFVFALDGLREPCRTFGLALAALAFAGGPASAMALGLFCLVTLRTDLFAISGAILFAWCLFCFFGRRRAVEAALPAASWAAGVFAVSFMTFLYTGYFLPGAQFVGLYIKIAGGG